MNPQDQTLTPERKAQLGRSVSIYSYHDRAQLWLAEYGKTDRYPTDWLGFNDYMYGGFGRFSDGELVVVGGETKTGKSTFVSHIAVSVANQGHKIDYISLENSYDMVYGQIAKISGSNNLLWAKDLIYSPDEDFIFGDSAWNAEDLIGHMEHMVKAEDIKVFVLDHLNFMFENEQQVKDELIRVRVVMRKISKFCTRNKATVFAISHMRKPESKSGKTPLPTVHSIYGSYATAAAATKVLLLHRISKEQICVKLDRSRYTSNRDTWFSFDTTSATEWLEKGEISL